MTQSDLLFFGLIISPMLLLAVGIGVYLVTGWMDRKQTTHD